MTFLQIKHQELAYAEKHGLHTLKRVVEDAIKQVGGGVLVNKQLKLF